MAQLSVPNLLGTQDLTLDDFNLIFETADNFKEIINRPIKKVPSLRDITIANIFFENSTRTRISFELAEKRLSADTINFSSSQSSVKKGETLLDTVNNIAVLVQTNKVDGAAELKLKNDILEMSLDKFKVKNKKDNTVKLFGAFEVGLTKFGTRKSQQVVVDINANELAGEFKTITITEKADKKAIKEAIKRGESVEGCELIDVLNLKIN